MGSVEVGTQHIPFRKVEILFSQSSCTRAVKGMPPNVVGMKLLISLNVRKKKKKKKETKERGKGNKKKKQRQIMTIHITV